MEHILLFIEKSRKFAKILNLRPFYSLMGIETILRAGKVKSVRQLNPDRIHFCLMKAIAAFTSSNFLLKFMEKLTTGYK